MSRKLIFLPEVSQDFIDAFSYYENLSPGRGGSRFEDAFRQAIREVKDGIITHKRAFEQFHRVLLRRFPYILYYRLADEQAVIAGVLYARFDPQKIEPILKGRSG